MHVSQIESVLRGIGADKVRTVSANKVACACPLARWTHASGRDNRPSFVVFVEGKYGDPIYKCQACHEEGSLRDLLLFIWTKGQDTYHWIEVLDDGADTEKARKRSETLLDARKESGSQGFEVRRVEVPEAEARAPLTTSDGRPFYDYKCLAEAEAVPEIPWEEYEPYAGSVPRYAAERGLTPETCREWELGHDRDGKRLLFPIRDRKGRLVAISGRLYATSCVRCGGEWVVLCADCGNDQNWHAGPGRQCDWSPARKTCEKCGATEPPKYLHRKGFNRNLMLYGEHRVQDETDGRVYVVEGHLDMIRMWQAGYRPVVALLGSSAGDAQVEKLIAHWGEGRIIAVPDGNKAGRDMVTRLKKMIVGRVPFTAKTLPEGTDPGGMTDDELRDLLGPPPFKVAA